MRSHWMVAALLTTALVAGCNGRNNNNSQNPEQDQASNAPAATDQTVAPAPTEPVPPSASVDNSAVRTKPSASARATTGRREPSTRVAAPSRTTSAPQA